MAFIPWLPFGELAPRSVTTSNTLASQLWKEFVMLRHIKTSKAGDVEKEIDPWIDQGKTYFLDALRSNWRSAGLLYYYSFLNLAKAYLAAKNTIAIDDLKTTSIQHGLSADPQMPDDLTKYEIKIHPPQSQNNRRNIFSTLFETITGEKWPYKKEICVSLSSIAGYCWDIGSELESLYDIKNLMITVQSLIRLENNHAWVELNVLDSKVSRIKTNVSSWPLEEVLPSNLTEIDKTDWLLSLYRTGLSFPDSISLRGPKRQFNYSNKHDIIDGVHAEALMHLRPFALPTVQEIPHSPYWFFVPKIKFHENELKWHPLLSNYLFAFVLSRILRYHPEILEKENRDYFLAEAWCNQSAVTTLRYFLMLFTNPLLRVNTI